MLKSGLMQKVSMDQENSKKQEKLINKYNISSDSDTEVVIVEKNNMIKFFIRLLTSAVRLIAQICITFLSLCGLVAIIYPESRSVLLGIVNDIFSQLKMFLPEGVGL